jgi:hypothetical protein
MALLLLGGCLASISLGTHAASAQNPTAWKITTQQDQLADRVSRIALTLPKTGPVQDGRSVTTALIISCGSPLLTGPTHPQLTMLFTPVEHMFHVDAATTRYRFDDGPIREYKLGIPGRNKAYAVQIPKFSDQDPIADLVAAKRLRAQVYLPPHDQLLDFNVIGAAEAVKAIACR